MGLLFPALLLILMYVLLIRPQQQRVRRQRALVQSLGVGDRVVSIGGVIGEIVAMDDETIEVEVADDVVITFLRGAISRKLDEPQAAADESESELAAGELDEGDDLDSGDDPDVDLTDDVDGETVNLDRPEGDR